MVAFIEHQQQVFGLRQYGFALQGGHHQRMVGDHHFRFLNLAPGDKKRALPVVVAVAVQTARLIGAKPAPQIIANGLTGVIAQAVPLIAVELGFELCTLLLLGLVVRRQFVVKKRQQILLIRLTAGERRQVTRAHVAPTPKRGGETQVGDNFTQQRQVLTEDLVL